MVSISSLYAGLLALLFLLLSVRVIVARRTLRVGLGDGQSDILLRRIRVHGNFAEYVPFVLLMMVLIEWQGGSKAILHVIGVLLLLGRGIHAYGLSHEPELPGFRVMGMACTLLALGGDRVGCFQSRVVGIGPQIGYIIPLGTMQAYVNLKGYREFDAQNRAHGWNTWLTVQLAPAAPSATPPPMSTRSMYLK